MAVFVVARTVDIKGCAHHLDRGLLSQLVNQRVRFQSSDIKRAVVSSTGECNILHLSQNWAFTHGNDEGARVLSFTKARALA